MYLVEREGEGGERERRREEEKERGREGERKGEREKRRWREREGEGERGRERGGGRERDGEDGREREREKEGDGEEGHLVILISTPSFRNGIDCYAGCSERTGGNKRVVREKKRVGRVGKDNNGPIPHGGTGECLWIIAAGVDGEGDHVSQVGFQR
jgi:hypothetical protein